MAGVDERGREEDGVGGGDVVVSLGVGILGHLVGEEAHLVLRTRTDEDEVVDLVVRIVEDQLHGSPGGHADFLR